VISNAGGRAICALDDAAAWPIQGEARHFRSKIDRRINGPADGEMLEAAE
jgi:NADH:ubiquinone oxidoreductase subunit F (NADH-binding)